MGTDIQAKTYFSGSYSARDLNDSAGSSVWSLYHDHESLKNGQNYDSFTIRPDGYLAYGKDRLRQTILNHDCVFRHQLSELHRLYKRQTDLMNEIKRRELHQHSVPTETLQSSLFLSYTAFEDHKTTCHVSDFPFVDPNYSKHLTSGADSVQFAPSFMEGLDIGVSVKESCPPNRNCEVTCEKVVNMSSGSGLSSGGNEDAPRYNLRSRKTGVMVDLNEPIQVKEASVSASADNLGNITCLDEELWMQSINEDAPRYNFCSSKTGVMVDLNEPIQIKEASVSASADNLGNITCLDEELWMQSISVTSKSGFHILSSKSSQSSIIGRNDNNVNLDHEGNRSKSLSYKKEAGQSRCCTFRGVVCHEDLPAPFKSLQVEPSKVDESSSIFPSDDSNKEPQRKRAIFGVEISEGNRDQSTVASQMSSLCGLLPQLDAANPETYSPLPWSKASSRLSQNILSVQESPCVSTSFPSNRSSSSSIPSLEFVGGKMQFSSNTKLVSRADVFYQHHNCLGPQLDIKQLRVSCSSIGYDFSNGINGSGSVPEQFVPHGSVKCSRLSDCRDVKSANDINSDVASPCRFRNEVILQQSPGPLDGLRKCDSPLAGLPWFNAKELSNNELTKGRKDYCLMNSHSLQNHSHESAKKSEMEKGSTQGLLRDSKSPISMCDIVCQDIKAGTCPSNREILGIPIFGVPQTSKDLTSLNSPSKVSSLVSDIGDGGGRKDLWHNPSSGSQLEVKDLVTEKRLGSYVSGLRHHIDLNVCMNEEEASLPTAIVKIATTEIDLEAPAVLESGKDPTPEVESSENRLMSPSELPPQIEEQSKEHRDEQVRIAAEDIIAISSSNACNLTEDIARHPLENSSSDSLRWFAEVVSSYEGDLDGKLRAVSRGNDSTNEEESMDYFEFMTLNLTETKTEECCNKPSAASQRHKDEGTETEDLLSKRTRRGQATRRRRRRQRKDFQRDVMPRLISLLRHEVAEDVRVIEGLFKASGDAWQPKAAKSSRGRRCSAPSPTPLRQPIYREQLWAESSLKGWGRRRTRRRLPRNRGPTDNPSNALKC